MSIVLGIIMFMVLVLLHEFGHFLAAKKSGAKVLEFGLGIPPKLFTIGEDSDGTEYTINLIPLGGFVRIKGEDPEDQEAFFADDSFMMQAFLKKILILFAGVTVNFLLAFGVFTFVFWQGVKPIQVVPENAMPYSVQSYLMPSYDFLEQNDLVEKSEAVKLPEIKRIVTGSLAEKNGLKKGNKIVSIADQEITNINLTDVLADLKGKEFNMKVKTDNGNVNKKIKCPKDKCMLGVMVDSHIKGVKPIKKSLGGAMGASVQEIQAQTKLTFHMLGKLGKGLFSMNQEKTEKAVKKMSGPVGAVKFGQMILQNGGYIQFLAFAGMISLALAIFNILPIPALDGGRALSVIVQAVFNLSAEKYFNIEAYINMIMFVLLMGLGVYIIFVDLARFWGIHVLGF